MAGDGGVILVDTNFGASSEAPARPFYYAKTAKCPDKYGEDCAGVRKSDRCPKMDEFGSRSREIGSNLDRNDQIPSGKSEITTESFGAAYGGTRDKVSAFRRYRGSLFTVGGATFRSFSDTFRHPRPIYYRFLQRYVQNSLSLCHFRQNSLSLSPAVTLREASPSERTHVQARAYVKRARIFGKRPK